VGNDSGGNVTLTVGATAGDILTLYRDMPYARTQNYTNSGDFLASEVNSDFDNLWLAGEQTNRSFSQSIRKPITDSDSISMELPAAANRANSFLTFDATGAPTVTSVGDPGAPSSIVRQQFTGDGTTTAFTLASAPGALGQSVQIFIDGVYQENDTYSISGTTLTFTEAPPVNASIETVRFEVNDIGETSANLVSYTPAGTGAVQTTVQTKLRESVSVKDFGAVGDGVTDDTAAIQAALDALDGTNSGGRLYIPTGTYIVSSTLLYQQTSLSKINPGIEIYGDGRRTSTLKYTGSSGLCLQLKGATGSAVISTGRLGLIEGVTIKSLGFVGTGVSSGNTDSGVYIQGFDHFLMEDFLVNNFPNYGVIIDRLYYGLSPDATLDDRGAFSTLRHGELSEIGSVALQAGGYVSSTDYSADHLHTEQLHITANDGVGAKIYAQNWTDVGSLFYGDSIGVHLYAKNSDILTQGVTMIGSRFEGGQSDCMLKIDSCLTGYFQSVFFAGHSGPSPATQIKIASDSSYNVGTITFESCIHQQATTAYSIVANGNLTALRVINPRFASVTTEVSNPNSKPVQMIKGSSYERITGGSEAIHLTGVSGLQLKGSLSTDAQPYFYFENSGKQLGFGNGSAAVDSFMKRLSISASARAGMSFSRPISVQYTQAYIHSGTGSPEGVVSANIGSLFLRTDGGTGTSFYIKESGSGNTGWVAK
jgi:hypothetical protein